jgi:hypothetical protein
MYPMHMYPMHMYPMHMYPMYMYPNITGDCKTFLARWHCAPSPGQSKLGLHPGVLATM